MGPRPAHNLWPYGQLDDNSGIGQRVGRTEPGDRVHGTQDTEGVVHDTIHDTGSRTPTKNMVDLR